MGARPSRQRPEAEQLPPPQPQAPSGPQTYAQYPPAQPYRPQQVPLPPPPGYYPASNGQYYGGYHPSYRPQPSPVPVPVPPPGSNRPYPHAPPPAPRPTAAPPRPAPTQELMQTATIRNAVNLKKASLAVTPLPGDPTKLAVAFTFDASAPCSATTFVAATEAPARGCRLTTAAQPPAPAVLFEKGLGHHFPGANAPPEVAAAHVVDLALYGPDPLSSGAISSAAGDSFPLVVRLEVVTERGAKAGHALSELAPGGEQKGWVQSQTTFAALRREEDGSWGVRVVKQKIWVEGVSYELQEIYGLEQAAAGGGGGPSGAAGADPAAGSAEESEERLCVICLVSPRDTTVLPCRHLCMCHECAQELRKQSSKCPICRNHCESLLHIRINNREKGGRQRSAAGRAASGVNAAAAEATAAAEPEFVA